MCSINKNCVVFLIQNKEIQVWKFFWNFRNVCLNAYPNPKSRSLLLSMHYFEVSVVCELRHMYNCHVTKAGLRSVRIISLDDYLFYISRQWHFLTPCQELGQSWICDPNPAQDRYSTSIFAVSVSAGSVVTIQTTKTRILILTIAD